QERGEAGPLAPALAPRDVHIGQDYGYRITEALGVLAGSRDLHLGTDRLLVPEDAALSQIGVGLAHAPVTLAAQLSHDPRREYNDRGGISTASLGFTARAVAPADPRTAARSRSEATVDQTVPKRKTIRVSVRFAALERDRYRCRYCGKEAGEGIALVMDHVVPVVAGGTNDLDNLVSACVDCNAGKGSRRLRPVPPKRRYNVRTPSRDVDMEALRLEFPEGSHCATPLKIAAIGAQFGFTYP